MFSMLNYERGKEGGREGEREREREKQDVEREICETQGNIRKNHNSNINYFFY
jgi:hypothetical protein